MSVTSSTKVVVTRPKGVAAILSALSTASATMATVLMSSIKGRKLLYASEIRVHEVVLEIFKNWVTFDKNGPKTTKNSNRLAAPSILDPIVSDRAELV